MFGPSKLETRINEKNISIEQRTNYPFSDKITVKIITEGPTKFSIFIRKPEWCDSMPIFQKIPIWKMDIMKYEKYGTRMTHYKYILIKRLK